MNIAIIGLGLIGGSLAKAIKKNTDNFVFGYDIDNTVLYKAKLLDAIDTELDTSKLKECDMVIAALYPDETVKFIKDNLDNFKENAIITDCCGIKEKICKEIRPLLQDRSFSFIGVHPMAGREYSGFDYAKGDLFNNASVILTPFEDIDIVRLETTKHFFSKIGFSSIVLTSPKEHDRIIAYTSQLAHIVSNAFVKSPAAKSFKGYSAGSFKDLTRVARLNEKLWSDLFLNNRKNLINELETIISNLNEYKVALENSDDDILKKLLKEGTDIKNQIDP